MLNLTIANWSGNVAKGTRLKLSDFMPRWARAKVPEELPEIREARLKASLCALALQTQKST